MLDLPPFDAVRLVFGPGFALTLDTAVGRLPTAGTLFHLRVGELLLTGIALDLFGLFFAPFAAFLLPGQTVRPVLVLGLVATDLAAVEFGITLFALDGETDNLSGRSVLFALDLSAPVISTGFAQSFAQPRWLRRGVTVRQGAIVTSFAAHSGGTGRTSTSSSSTSRVALHTARQDNAVIVLEGFPGPRVFPQVVQRPSIQNIVHVGMGFRSRRSVL